MNRVTRRTFVRAAAGAAALASTSLPRGRAGAAELPKRKFKLNLNVGQVGVRATPMEAVGLAKKHGYGSVTPMAGAMGRYSDEQMAELAAAMRKAGLVWGASGIGPFFDADEERFKAKRERIAKAAKLLQRAKVTRCFTWVPPGSKTRTYRANFRLHVKRTREVVKLLADLGLRIGLEYLGTKTMVLKSKYPFVQTLAEMKELTEEVGLDNVGLALDSWHWFQAGDTEQDIASLTNRQAVTADICDAPAGIERHRMPDSPRKLPCTTGVIDLKPFLTGLVKIGYDGPLGTEPFDRTLRTLTAEKAMTVATKAMNKALALIE